jgi:two-component system chemotaxis response regulator CheY
VPSRGTILVVDDDDDTRQCVQTVLLGEGYEVAVARDGREALDLLLNGATPDLVLLDLMMPVMSGWDVLEAMSAKPDLSALPVVVFTAAGEPVTGAPALGRPVLRKPIDLDLLLEMVDHFCAVGWVLDEPPSNLMPKVTAPR